MRQPTDQNNIDTLPLEVLALIVQDLSYEKVSALSRTNSNLHNLFQNNVLYRVLLRKFLLEGFQIEQVGGGDGHRLIRNKLGQVWADGDGSHGQIAMNPHLNKPGVSIIPAQIKGLPKICAFTAGPLFSLFLDENGTVWICGDNFFGQFGLGPGATRGKKYLLLFRLG